LLATKKKKKKKRVKFMQGEEEEDNRREITSLVAREASSDAIRDQRRDGCVHSHIWAKGCAGESRVQLRNIGNTLRRWLQGIQKWRPS